MIFSLRQVQERAIEQGQDLYLIFIDFKKAFDMVSRDVLWKVLEILGCPRKFVNIVKDLHINMNAKVSVSGFISEEFEVNKGVKQGDPTPPTYFTLFLTAILNLLAQVTQEGVYIRTRSDGKLFNLSRLKAFTKVRTELIRDLLYADDAAMMAHSLEAIQEITSRFSEISKAFGLQINIHKTELLYQPTPNNRNRENNAQPIVTIDGEVLNTVRRFKYLGSYVSDDNKVNTEISHRIQMASAAYRKLKKRLWDSHEISLTTKLAVFRAVIYYPPPCCTPWKPLPATFQQFKLSVPVLVG
jgi:sorting nexin-29